MAELTKARLTDLAHRTIPFLPIISVKHYSLVSRGRILKDLHKGFAFCGLKSVMFLTDRDTEAAQVTGKFSKKLV